jgi:hypothetical protein
VGSPFDGVAGFLFTPSTPESVTPGQAWLTFTGEVTSNSTASICDLGAPERAPFVLYASVRRSPRGWARAGHVPDPPGGAAAFSPQHPAKFITPPRAKIGHARCHGAARVAHARRSSHLVTL